MALTDMLAAQHEGNITFDKSSAAESCKIPINRNVTIAAYAAGKAAIGGEKMNGDIRDEFATTAMASLIREGYFTRQLPADSGARPTYERLARMAYEIADAMVCERLGVQDDDPIHEWSKRQPRTK